MTRPGMAMSWRWHHLGLLLLALLAPLLVPWWLGGPGTIEAIADFPGFMLVLMGGVAMLCWNLNATRWRLLLSGRAGRLGQDGALAIEKAAKFALCGTLGGSGGALLLPLMERDQAAAAVVIWRLASYHLYLLAGGPVFFVLAARWLARSTAS